MSDEWEAALETHRDRRRNAIHRAAVELATEHGVAGVSMIDIARRAGISRATLYKYFPSVEAVLASYTVDEIDRERAALERELAELAEPLERLRAMLEHLLGYFASEEHLSASAAVDPHHLSPAVGAEVGEAMSRVHELIRAEVGAATGAGMLRANAEPEVLAEVFRHLLHAGRTLVVDRGERPDAAAELIWQQFLHGAANPLRRSDRATGTSDRSATRPHRG